MPTVPHEMVLKKQPQQKTEYDHILKPYYKFVANKRCKEKS